MCAGLKPVLPIQGIGAVYIALMALGVNLVISLGGSVLLVAGVYQFSRWKETCLRACRSPLTFVMTHDFGRGSLGAFRMGMSHGLHCDLKLL